ncbi:MAG: hypothetical protein GF411_02990 [Candidatus Lokiarchaeota archaeon]|nr:hypothetical protein [Candidatus Lokiarchaeota archaeon]
MRTFFEVISTVNRWLRQRYSSTSSTPRIFWNQIMVVLGIIMLKQENIAPTLGNLERYTPVPKSSIYRTLKVLEEESILIQKEDKSYGFYGEVPQDILELSTNRTPVELGGLVEEIESAMKKQMKQMLQTLPLQQDQIEQVSKRIDTIKPEKKELDALSSLVGDGFM